MENKLGSSNSIRSARIDDVHALSQKPNLSSIKQSKNQANMVGVDDSVSFTSDQ